MSTKVARHELWIDKAGKSFQSVLMAALFILFTTKNYFGGNCGWSKLLCMCKCILEVEVLYETLYSGTMLE